MQKLALLLGILVLPSSVFGAGFAQQSIFLSKSSVTEGDVVLIHTVVQNDSAAAFPGNVVIKDSDIKVGAVPVTLGAGEAQAVSVSWKPAAGSHKVTAELQDAGGTVVGSESETFTVKEKPKPATEKPEPTVSNSAAAIESSADIQATIDSLSPAAGGALAPVFKLVDGSRVALADVLDTQIAKTKPKVGPIPGIVAGTSTINAPDQASWVSSIFATVYFYILTVLRYILGSAGIFYPVLAFVFLFTLWKLFRRFRRAN